MAPADAPPPLPVGPLPPLPDAAELPGASVRGRPPAERTCAPPPPLPDTADLPGASVRWRPLAERTCAPLGIFARLVLRLRDLEAGTAEFCLPAKERSRENRLLNGWYFDVTGRRFLFVNEDAVDSADEALTFWPEGDGCSCFFLDTDGVAWGGKTNVDLFTIHWTKARSSETTTWIRLSYGRI